jgi:hypothetical protein
MTGSTAQMAQRALDDIDFAQAVHEGKEGNDEVRAAIAADLSAAASGPAGEPEVAGFQVPMVITKTMDSSSPNLYQANWGTGSFNPALSALANPLATTFPVNPAAP